MGIIKYRRKTLHYPRYHLIDTRFIRTPQYDRGNAFDRTWYLVCNRIFPQEKKIDS